MSDPDAERTTAAPAPEPLPVHPIEDELFQLARLGDIRGLQAQFDSAKYNARSTDPQGLTALHWAALNGQYAVCHFLVQSGADVNAKGGDAVATPLHWALEQRTKTPNSIVRLMLDHGADPTIQDVSGYNVLINMAMFGKVNLLIMLISLSAAPVDAPNFHRTTPLMFAATKGKTSCVDALLKLGANPNAQDEHGNTPLMWSMFADRPNPVCMQKLLQHGADKFHVNDRGQTIGAIARERGDAASKTWHTALSACGLQPSGKTIEFPLPFVSHPGTFLYLFFIVWPFVIIGMAVYIASSFPIYIGLPASLFVSLVLQFSGQKLLRWAPSGMRHLKRTPFLAGIFLGTLAWVGIIWGTRLSRYTLSTHPFTNLAFATCFSLAGYFHIMTMLGDPGSVQPVTDRAKTKATIYELLDNDVYDERHFCTHCMIRRPLRSKHCMLCNRCVARHDHHCPWVHNCVGVNNHAHFLLFLLFLLTGIALLIPLSLAYVEALPRPANAVCTLLAGPLCDEYSKDPFGILICSWGALQLTWTTMLLLVQLSQIARAITTYEAMRGLNMGPVATALATGSASAAGAQITSSGAGPDPLTEDSHHHHHHHRQRGSCWATWAKLLGVDTFVATARSAERRESWTTANPFTRGILGNCADFWCAEGGIRGLVLRKENGLGLLHGVEVDYTHLYEMPRGAARARGGYRSVPVDEERTGSGAVN